MQWNAADRARLSPILDRICGDLSPLDGKDILVLDSGRGELPIWLAERMQDGCITGLELDAVALAAAQQEALDRGVTDHVMLGRGERTRIAFPDDALDAVIRELIVCPASQPSLIGQTEMARVLKPGGMLILTDLLVTAALPLTARKALAAVGLNYLYETTPDDLRRWLAHAGLADIMLHDLTPLMEEVWARRRDENSLIGEQMGYTVLLDDPDFRLGRGIHYLYARARKPG